MFRHVTATNRQQRSLSLPLSENFRLTKQKALPFSTWSPVTSSSPTLVMDSEFGEDNQPEQTDNNRHVEVLDNSTDNEHQPSNDVAMIGNAVENVSHHEQNDEMTQNPSGMQLNAVEVVEPYVGQEFETEAAAHAFYSAYGMRLGFITRINYHNRSKLDGSIISRAIVCNKEGYRKPYRHGDAKNVRSRAPTRVGCKAMITLRKMSTERWVITKFVKEHTHPLTGGQGQKALIYNQIPNEDKRVQELTQQLLIERKRSASLRRFIDLLFHHIEEHTLDLSKKVQYIVDSVNMIESEGKREKHSESQIVL